MKRIRLLAALVFAATAIAPVAHADGPKPLGREPKAILDAMAGDDEAQAKAGHAAVTAWGADGVLPILSTCKGYDEDTLDDLADALSEIGEKAVTLLINGLFIDGEDGPSVATAALLRMGNEAEIRLVSALQSNKAELRAKSAAVLVQMDDLDVDAVADVMKSKDENVQSSAAAVLTEFGETGAEALVDTFAFGDKAREISVSALVQIGAEAVRPLLSALRSTDEKVQEAAVDALSGIGKPAVAALASATRDARSDVRGSAACALGNTKEESAVPALLPLLDDADESVRNDAQEALEDISGEKLASRSAWEAWWRGKSGGAKPGGTATRSK